jgi:hypothetical protein
MMNGALSGRRFSFAVIFQMAEDSFHPMAASAGPWNKI